jgi:hypothetical protein
MLPFEAVRVSYIMMFCVVGQIYVTFVININGSCIPVQYSSMKQCFAGIIILMILLAGCDDSPIPSSIEPVLPALPAGWKEILGEPHWRFEWLSDNGIWQKVDISPGTKTPGLSPPNEWTTPVLAWPYWPAWGLIPGMMKPAGALFPWDASGGSLRLGWKGGVDAVFWKELAAAERLTDAAEKRIPWFFDWPRFRELLENGNIPDSVRGDLWLADWKEVARKTVLSGLDRRRITAMKFQQIEIPDLEGSWAGSSPFAAPMDAPPGGPLCLDVTDEASTWVSSAGVLKCSAKGWVLIEK